MVDNLLVSRYVRTNDVEILCCMLGDITDIFFTAHRHSYARYVSLYFLEDLNMDITHSDIRQQLERGAFSVRCSTNCRFKTNWNNRLSSVKEKPDAGQ